MLVIASVALSACGAGSASHRPSVAPAKVAATIPSATPAATPSPQADAAASATATPVTSAPIDRAGALALGGGTPVRSVPSMAEGRTVRTLADRQPLEILREVRGQRWIVGDQTWAMAIQDWTNVWYQVDGGYVYAGFVFIPRAGEIDAILDRSGIHWVDVDVNAQTATAMVGDRAVRAAAATSGKPGFETPGGEHTVQYRKFNETMTSTQAAIQDPNEQYDVKNVLYTQYFDGAGDALHLNYWQPDGVFGRQRTSHGCVGLGLHDAQFFWLFATSGTRVSIHPVASVTSTPAASATASPVASGTATSTVTPAQSTGTPAAAPTQDPSLSQRFRRVEAPQATNPPPPPPPVFPARPPVR